MRSESDSARSRKLNVAADEPASDASLVAGQEPVRRDPKGGELCLGRAKPEETLVEARSDTDVQIVRRTWV